MLPEVKTTELEATLVPLGFSTPQYILAACIKLGKITIDKATTIPKYTFMCFFILFLIFY